MERAFSLYDCRAFDPPGQSTRNAEAHVRSIVSAMNEELRHGRIAIHGTAAQLGISIRSLQRRLKCNGLTYRSLVEAVRKDRALVLLESTKLTITEIAMELGYSEHANFTRAFRRWTGQSPQLYRQQSLLDARRGFRLSINGVGVRSQATI